jgi:hypothetical protein
MFEKYWSKPSLKKKTQPDTSNPAKETMTRVPGTCSMTIEPHVFEVALYEVRDTHYTFLPPVNHAQSTTNPMLGPQGSNLPGGVATNAQRTGAAQSFQAPLQQQKPPTQPLLPPFREGFAQFEPQGLPPIMSGSFAGSPRAMPPNPITTSSSVNGSCDTGTVVNEVPKDSPVIQMLAARAATNHSLKSLMKVVAQGSASTDQLAVFQHHIDELNEILAAQKGKLAPDNVAPYSKAVETSALTSAPEPARSVPLAPLLSVKQEPLSQYYSQPPQYQSPQYLKPKRPGPASSEVTAVVFDFGTSGTGDRYLIPKYSSLEYLPGNTQALLSFLLTKKGDTAASGNYKPNVDYYEPITVRLSASTPRALQCLSKAVAPAEEVRKYMSDIMGRMTRAEDVYVVTQLPRSHENRTQATDEMDQVSDEEILKVNYLPPSSVLPLRPTRRT